MAKRRPKVQPPKPPLAAAMVLQSALRGRINRLHAWVKRRIVNAWGSNARATKRRKAIELKEARKAEREDANRSPWIEEKLRSANEVLSQDDPTPAVELVAGRVDRHNGREMKRLIPISLREDPDIGPQLDDFREDCLDRISDLDDDAIDELRDILGDAEEEGWRVEDLADVIADRLEVSGSKAELMARSQVLSFNAEITRERQTASGIEQFEWSTSGDERVRESHDELDGEIFSWDDLPTVDDEDDVMPGKPPNCRCVAIPQIPEEEDEEDDEDDEDDEASEDEAMAAEE